jgi:hypothetical protein
MTKKNTLLLHLQLHYTHQQYFNHDIYEIKVHDLIRSFLAILLGDRKKLWREFYLYQGEKLRWGFFLDPLQWWDHRLKKVIELQILLKFTFSLKP